MNEISRRGAADGPKRSTNLTLPEALVEEARALGVNLSAEAERGIADAVQRRRAEGWVERNREAMESWNRHVEEHGLPLESLRLF